MRKLFLSLSVMLVALIAISQNAFATLPAVTASPNEQWRVELNNSSPSNTRTQLGSRLEGPLVTGSTIVAAQTGSAANPVGKCALGAGTFTTPTTKAYLKTTGAAGTVGESYCLGDGFQDQPITFQLTSGSKDFVITPATKTGFTDVTLTSAKQAVTLIYLDSTDGWAVQGNVGATVN